MSGPPFLMDLLAVPEAIVGGALLFFIPGFTVARAVFPAMRLRGPGGLRDALELVTLAFTLSVVLTVLVGYALLTVTASGFSATWSNPLLEASLAAVALVALAVGLVTGAYSAHPPDRPTPTEPGGEGAWELGRALDRLRDEEARIRRALERSSSDPEARARLERRLGEVRNEARTLERSREAEYDL